MLVEAVLSASRDISGSKKIDGCSPLTIWLFAPLTAPHTACKKTKRIRIYQILGIEKALTSL